MTLESIGGILARSQPGHSMISKTVDAVCGKCGISYQAKVHTINGKEYGFTERCPDCHEKERREQEREALLKELEQVEQSEREVWIDEYNVPGFFREKTFDNFDRKLQPRAFKALFDWKEGSLVLFSPDSYGVGKTHLVCALANRLIATEESVRIINNEWVKRVKCPVYFTTENRLRARIRQTFNKQENGETDEGIYNLLSNYRMLIIDDVGKVRPRDYSFLQGVYFRVIDDRYVTERDIILTTNLDLTELEEHVGGPSADRLRAMVGKAGFINMAGKSYRRP